ncbi:WD40 repeat-like protein [Favolaschia claudopus]|uniref:WD40 repeat-like protein n=1 Tax=Favolaschia claudopus TaxID=2862362 RepID=A0AAV9ZKN5_9AGAR
MAFTLQVCRAEVIVWQPGFRDFRSSLPNLYVEVYANGTENRILKTRVVKEDKKPIWNHDLDLPSPSLSMCLVFRLYHDVIGPDRLIAEASILVEDLMERSLSDDVWLDIKSNGDVLGRLSVSLRDLTGSQATAHISGDVSNLENSSLVAHAASFIQHIEEVTSSSRVSAAFEGILSALENIVKVGDELAKIHPYATTAWNVLTFVYKMISRQREMDDKIVKLVEAMAKLYAFAAETDSVVTRLKSLEDIVLRITIQTVECALLIREYSGHGFLGRIANNFFSGAEQKIDELAEELITLKDHFDRGAVVQTMVVSSQIFDRVERLENFNALSQLTVPSQRPLMHRECLQGTRTRLIAEIAQQLLTPSEARVVWLSGVAGSGKSTIATSISAHFRRLGRLGATLRFARDDVVGGEPTLVLHAIAFGLAKANPHIEQAICNALSRDSTLLSASLDEQFQALLQGPLDSAKQHLVGPIVIVMDALDECADHFRHFVANLIANSFTKLPSAFKFFVTSRPDSGITKLFQRQTAIEQRSLNIATGSTEDIAVYIHNRLATIRLRHPFLDPIWPGPEQTLRLIELSGNLFIWAATALDFVEGKNSFQPCTRLEALLKTPFREGGNLGQLYTLALQSDGDWGDENFRRPAADILATITLAKAPLTASALDMILALHHGTAARVLECLGSVIQWSVGLPARALHPSFADFIMESASDRPWSFDVVAAKKSLARGCLVVLQQHLAFNLCNHPNSHLLNSEVPGLTEAYLPEALTYASQFWANHLEDSSFDHVILNVLKSFLGSKFLFWLEVLSIKGKVAYAENILQQGQRYVLGKDNWAEMFLDDAEKFVAVFAPAIAASVPHIYISAIPLAPKHSMIRAHYLSSFPRLLGCILPHSWSAVEKSLRGHTESVTSVAFSPDGLHIVSGSADRTVRIWDCATGAPVGKPLRGHQTCVTSVAFSPDSLHIVSGSGDRTARIWDASTCAPIGEPLQGHDGSVTSVTFSPDGLRLVSGSVDRTVRIWDAATGAPLGEPLRGHHDTVMSVAFAPDGLRIVSGSMDQTVRIWDATTGVSVGGPLEGHNHWVTSVASSQDGLRFASGSRDQTIRIWNAITGAPIGPPLQGHRHSVTSIAFSLDSLRLISGSGDQTARCWDVATGVPVGEPLHGHTSHITSVAFSPDNLRVVSGSADRTARIWNTNTGSSVGESLKGHNDWVTSVAFSPDGLRVASASGDRTVRIWNAATGVPVGEPLQGHSELVAAVAFSPDGLLVVSGSDDRTVRIWNAATGAPVGEPLRGHSQPVTSVAFSLDGLRLVSGSGDQTVRIWNANTGSPVGESLKGHNDWVTSVAFSPDGLLVASASGDRTVRIWNAATGVPVGEPLQGHSDLVAAVVFSPDGLRVASGSDDRTVRIWNAATGAPVGKPLQGHSQRVTSVAFSLDGSRLVSGSRDQTVRIWDATTGEQVGEPLQGHNNRVASVGFSPDGLRVVSGGGDRTIRVWNVPSQEHASTHHVTLHPAEFPLISPGNFQDGWVASASLRLVWIPPFLQNEFCMPWCSYVIAPGGVNTLDVSRFVHGTEWEKCIDDQFRNSGLIDH